MLIVWNLELIKLICTTLVYNDDDAIFIDDCIR